MPPSHCGVGGGVPPNGRLPHPPHLGPLETRQRGEPSLTPPRSPHFEAGLTVGHHPHGRRGWVDWGKRHSHPPPCPEFGPQLEGDRRLESPESWCSLKEHHQQELEQELSQPVHHGQLGCHRRGRYPQMAPDQVESLVGDSLLECLEALVPLVNLLLQALSGSLVCLVQLPVCLNEPL